VKSASALVSLRETVLDHQLRRGDLLEIDRDLLGGIVLTGADSPLPTWQSLRPMGLLASMLGDESLTPGTIRSGEVSGQMLRMLEMLRFVRQLSAGEAVTHMYTDPGLSIGGVRASLWDQQMPLTASSLALVTVCETLESMERIRGRRRPAAGGR
jgi:hypothetical protein